MTGALIFDLDGVLILSEEPRFRVMQQAAKKHNVELENKHLKHIVGTTTRNFLARVLSDIVEETRELIISTYEKEYKGNIAQHVTPIAATVDFIKDYQGTVPMALATMNEIKTLHSITDFLGITKRFAALVPRDGITHHKPDPEIYFRTAEVLRVAPENCIVIEDSPVGVEAGIRAGMQTYGFLNGWNSEKEFRDFSVRGLLRTKADIEALPGL